MVVVWNTLNVIKGGEVTILAKAHTDVDIHTMKVAFFDDTRYPPFYVFLFAYLIIFLANSTWLHVCAFVHLSLDLKVNHQTFIAFAYLLCFMY